MICQTCHGNGYVRRPKAAALNRIFKYTTFRVQTHMNCPVCNAQGVINDAERSDTELLAVGQ